MPDQINNHDDVAGRVATLEGRWKQTDSRLEHLDGRVGALSETMSAVLTKVDAVVIGMDRITSRVNQPLNLWAILSFIVAFVMLCLAIVAGGSTYVDLRLTPLAELDQRLIRWVGEIDGKVEQRGAVMGAAKARISQLEKDLEHTDSLRHQLEEQVARLREQAAAAEVSRRATGDYVRQVDEMGSRAWIGKGPRKASKVGE